MLVGWAAPFWPKAVHESTFRAQTTPTCRKIVSITHEAALALKGADVSDVNRGRAGADVAEVVGTVTDGAGTLVTLVTAGGGAGEELADQSCLYVGVLVTGTLCG